MQGSVELWWWDRPTDEAAYAHKVVVSRAFAGTGVVKALFAQMESLTLGAKRALLRLDTPAHRPPLIALCERLEFTTIDERTVGGLVARRVEKTLIHHGQFAPRTMLGEGRRDFVISVELQTGSETTRIVVPDISGEMWRKAALSSEIDAEWMDELKHADGAVLFVRVLSPLNEDPLDWVTTSQLLSHFGQDERRTSLPTQVMLCELLRFLEYTLVERQNGQRPRVAVVVTAWDLLDIETAARGPESFLRVTFPLFAGRIEYIERLEIRTFGVSVVGGDVGTDVEFRESFLNRPFNESGWVAFHDPEAGQQRIPDITLPLAWVVGR